MSKIESPSVVDDLKQLRKMPKNESKIQWTQFTGGPWLLCTEVSPGCAHCYAKTLMETRLGHGIRQAYKKAGFSDWETRPVWGKTAPRVLTKGFWTDARRVNAAAAKSGAKPKWFPSMIDWLDEMPAGIIDRDGNVLDPLQLLADFLALIRECQNIDFLLLTKRPENWLPLMNKLSRTSERAMKYGQFSSFVREWLNGTHPSNIRIGVSCENQKQADERIPQLLKIPAACRFLSVEPMLGNINFRHLLGFENADGGKIDLAIFGGESGSDARPCNIEWIRDGVKQCQDAQVAVFVKQIGSRPESDYAVSRDEWLKYVIDKKGGDMSEWPADLRIRDPWPEMKA